MRTFVVPDTVSELASDLVIVATASTPRRDGFRVICLAEPLPGADRKHVYTGWDVLGSAVERTSGDSVRSHARPARSEP